MIETTPLTITHQQRKALIEKLIRTFGERVTAEATGGNSVGLTSAQLLHSVLEEIGSMKDRDGSRI
jgi:hypothetical protein